MQINFDTLSPKQRYSTMTQTIVPRPIAWVLTDNGSGSYNLAPYSYFTAICSAPPLLMISASKKPTGQEAGQIKDTCLNIREHKNFVVHIPSTRHINAVNASAETLLRKESEVEKLSLPTTPMENFELPRLTDCGLAMACTLYRMDEIGDTPQFVIYGEIKSVYIQDELIETQDGRTTINASKLDPLTRLGGLSYGELGGLLEVARPD